MLNKTTAYDTLKREKIKRDTREEKHEEDPYR